VKTLVTGATGFIGKHLVKRLVEEGRTVICLVRKTSNVDELKKLKVEIIYGDLLDYTLLNDILIDTEIGIIYHLGGAVYSRKSKNYREVNILGTKNLLEACCDRNRIKKFILVSSITAVGPQRQRQYILNEDTLPNPIPPYGMSKYESEKIALKYSKDYNLPLVIVRPPLVYGPEQSLDMTNIFKKIEKGLFRIIGDGEFITSLCYIDNLIDGLLLIEKNNNSIGQIYFIADNKYYTFKEIAETISKEMDVNLPNVKIPKWFGNLSGLLYQVLHKFFGVTSITLYSLKLMTLNFACDISKIRRELSYKPAVDLEEGIRRTVKWYKAEFANHGS